MFFNNDVSTAFHLSNEANKFKEILAARSQHCLNNPGMIPNEGAYHFQVKLLVGLSITTLLVKDHAEFIPILSAFKEFIFSIDRFENSHQPEDLFSYTSSVAVIVARTVQRMKYAEKSFLHYDLFSKTLRDICENVAVIITGKEKEAKELLIGWLQ